MEEAKGKMQDQINNLKKDIEDMENNLKKVNACFIMFSSIGWEIYDQVTGGKGHLVKCKSKNKWQYVL